MGTTDNTAWDDRLELYKGSDTSHFVRTTVSNVRKCADCQQPIDAGSELSILVEVTESDEDPYTYKKYDSWVCHRPCQPPTLKVILDPDLKRESEYDSYGVRAVLRTTSAFGEQLSPAIFFSVLSRPTIRTVGGERTSVWMSNYLHSGFQISFTADLSEIIDASQPVNREFRCTISRNNLLGLELGQDTIYTLQLDGNDPDDVLWLNLASTAGTVLAVVGENFVFTDNDVQVDAAAQLGTLATGTVRVHHIN